MDAGFGRIGRVDQMVGVPELATDTIWTADAFKLRALKGEHVERVVRVGAGSRVQQPSTAKGAGAALSAAKFELLCALDLSDPPVKQRQNRDTERDSSHHESGAEKPLGIEG